MKKVIAKVVLLILFILPAISFTGCWQNTVDGRIPVSVLSYFKNGLCPVLDEDSKWGYVDKSGRMKIEPQFDSAYRFVGDSALVKLNGVAKLIDEKGKAVSKEYNEMYPVYYGVPMYEKITYLAKKYSDDGKMVTYISVSAKGKEIFSEERDKVDDYYGRPSTIGEALIVTNGKDGSEKRYGARSLLTGKEILAREYEELSQIDAYEKSNTPAVKTFIRIAKTEDIIKYGLADMNGKILIRPKYDNIDSFYNGVARARVDGNNYDFISTTGKILFSKETFPNNSYFDSKGIILYQNSKDMKYHTVIADKKGRTIAEGEYDYISSGYNGDYVYHNSESDFIVKQTMDASAMKHTITVYNLKGKSLFNVTGDNNEYSYIEAYSQFGITFHDSASNITKMYDKSGKATNVTIESKKDLYDPVFNEFGLGTVYSEDGEARVIDLKNRIIVNDAALQSTYYNYILKDFDAIPFRTADGKTGFINSKGKILLKAKNEGVSAYSYYGGSLFAAEEGGKWGYVNKEGNFVINAEYDSASPFIEGYAAVVKDGKYGIINTKGKQVVPCIYGGIGSIPTYY